MNKIFIASKNKGKIKEITSVLGGPGIELLSLINMPDIPDIPETGSTFRENAAIKAKAVYEIVNIPVLADDSGLEVDYLNGAPGVYSARYAGENVTDEENRVKLLKAFEGVEFNKRGARFKCVLVLFDGISEKYFEGAAEGHITESAKGDKGFGYDPLFQPVGYSQTFAELEPDIKNKISHRGKALSSFKEYLNGLNYG